MTDPYMILLLYRESCNGFMYGERGGSKTAPFLSGFKRTTFSKDKKNSSTTQKVEIPKVELKL